MTNFEIRYPNFTIPFKIGYEEHREFYATCEPQTVKYFTDTIKEHWNIIDVGANIGMMTLLFGNLTKGKIFPIEASPDNFNMLLENIKNYPQKATIIPYNYYISNEDKEVEGEIHYLWTSAGPVGSSKGTYKFQTLDNIFKDFSEPIDLIKIDIDGWDYEAVQGCINILDKHSPILVVEVVPWGLILHKHTEEEVVGFLKQHNYELKRKLDDYNFVFEKTR